MQIRFESETKHGVFKDALNLPDDHTFTDAELLDMQAARIAAWVDRIDNPPLAELLADEAAPVDEPPLIAE